MQSDAEFREQLEAAVVRAWNPQMITAGNAQYVSLDTTVSALLPLIAVRVAQQRLQDIDWFGCLLADAEIACGQKHRAEFTKLSTEREKLLSALTAAQQGAKEGL